MQGTVKWFNETKGFGFIKGDKGGDVLVRHAHIVGEGYKTLSEGERVEFDIVPGTKGPEARDVVRLRL